MEVTFRLLIFSKLIFQLALGHSDSEDEISMLDMYRRSKGLMKKAKLLKRLYTEDQIEAIY